MKLFAIYIGGEMPGANIEVHDLRFVVAPSILDTHDELRRQWWGKPDSLHVDCWAEIDHVDGYDVTLETAPFAGEERLYYVNLGGYDHGEFTEQHKNVFVVAKTVHEAKAKALKAARSWDALHRDDMYEAEQAFVLDDPAHEQRLFVHLTRAPEIRPLTFTCHYTPIKAPSRKFRRVAPAE